jgi:hypothetical protein
MKPIVFFLAILSFCSCSKDDSNSVAKKPLKAIRFSWDNGGQAHVEFNYDNSNRVTRMFAYYGSFQSTVAAADTIFESTMFYQGNSLLPAQIKHATKYGSTTEVIMHQLQYGGDNRLQRDSVYNVSFAGASKLLYFTYENDWVILKSGGRNDSMKISNGNYIYQHNNAGDPSVRADYDNAPNPLNDLNIAPVFHLLNNRFSPLYTLWSYWFPSNRNNLLKLYSSASFPAGTPSAIMVYDYDSGHRPVRRMSYGSTIVGLPTDTLTYMYF